MKKDKNIKKCNLKKCNWERILIVFGFIILFIGGVLIGTLYNKTEYKKIGMTDIECSIISDKMARFDVRNLRIYDEQEEHMIKRAEVYLKQLKELNSIYEKNCAGRIVEKTKLVEEKIEENVVFEDKVPLQTCEVIERELKRDGGLYSDGEGSLYSQRIDRAKSYAKMYNYGCLENAEKHKENALREIEIANAINDSEINENEALELIDAYNRLEMKKEIEQVIDKTKKLIDPAIDFFIQVEKIINSEK